MGESFENLGPRWYVVHTYSGYENKVKTNIEKIVDNRGLQNIIFDVRVPTVESEDEGGAKQSEPAKSSKDKKEIEEKLYPSYVLVKMEMSDASWHIVRNISGVTGFVGPGSKPVPITDEEVAQMGVDVREIDLGYTVGDGVKVKNGPMSGFIGVVQTIGEDKKSALVIVSMFGRETPMEIETKDLEKLVF
jgi:transcriptional antiterminator NusG